jgi:hypothetical protein
MSTQGSGSLPSAPTPTPDPGNPEPLSKSPEDPEKARVPRAPPGRSEHP